MELTDELLDVLNNQKFETLSELSDIILNYYFYDIEEASLDDIIQANRLALDYAILQWFLDFNLTKWISKI